MAIAAYHSASTGAVNSVRMRFAFVLFVALVLALAVAFAVGAAGPAFAAESPACREIERRFELIKSAMISTQLNATLFAAADKGCEPLTRALLAAGASLEARDRL